jgi:hypothetical protein
MSTDAEMMQAAAPTAAEVAEQVEEHEVGRQRAPAASGRGRRGPGHHLRGAAGRHPASGRYRLGTPARRLTVEFSRFCWECGGTRVRAAMQFGDVIAVKSRGLPRLPDAPLELLAIDFEEVEAPGGKVTLMFAGGGDLRVEVECLDAVVADLSDRWEARVAPTHLDAAGEDDGPSETAA